MELEPRLNSLFYFILLDLNSDRNMQNKLARACLIFLSNPDLVE
jgi:hypothetical protein